MNVMETELASVLDELEKLLQTQELDEVLETLGQSEKPEPGPNRTTCKCGRMIAFMAAPVLSEAPKKNRLIYDPPPGVKFGKPHRPTGLCVSCRTKEKK